jgi:hypothetical protein
MGYNGLLITSAQDIDNWLRRPKEQGGVQVEEEE